jgi:hypothetical protein
VDVDRQHRWLVILCNWLVIHCNWLVIHCNMRATVIEAKAPGWRREPSSPWGAAAAGDLRSVFRT